MIYFSDRDVVRKLAACGFLPLLPELLGVADSDLEIRYLVSLKGSLTRGSQKLENIEFQRHLIDFCERHSVIGAAASVRRVQELLDGGMDPGEALLFAEGSKQTKCSLLPSAPGWQQERITPSFASALSCAA